jgi:hypothetical protein
MKVALPLPVTIGGSTVTTERVTGPSSRMYPMLRDLWRDREHEIIVEFDTEKSRKVGKLQAQDIELIAQYYPKKRNDEGFYPSRQRISLKDIIAFRVLEVRKELEG